MNISISYLLLFHINRSKDILFARGILLYIRYYKQICETSINLFTMK